MAERPEFRGGLAASFGFAFHGLAALLRTQRNARIHAAATLAVLAAGISCSLAREEWLWIIAASGLVWTAEALNTALEAIVDLVSPDLHPLAGRAKDLAAAAVLCAAITAAVIGLCIFTPHLLVGLEISPPS